MRRGFTFIELMSVLAIIAILAAILFPVFARAREKARQSSCLSNLANLGAGLRMYAADHYGHLPPTDNDLSPLFPKVLSDSGVLLCPTVGALDRPMRPAPENEALATDYVYRGGLEDDALPTNLVACDRDPTVHNEGANYLLLEGRVKWHTGDWDQTDGPANYYFHAHLDEFEGFEEIARLRGEELPDEPPPEDEPWDWVE